jgi:hypothetical protein
MVFFGLVSIKKTGLTLAFFLSSSNRNHGKAFAVLSKKNTNIEKLDRVLVSTYLGVKTPISNGASFR